MKKKTENRIRHGRLAGALFVLGVLALAVYGSFGAYTNFNSVKRVVSTKESQSDTMFSSNYLSQLGLSDTNYPVKRISLSQSGDKYTFTVLVCNYVWGDETRYNPKNINFTITAKLLSMDGGALPEGITAITMNNTHFGTNGECTLENQTLTSGNVASKEYKIEILEALKDKVKFQIVAKPLDDSRDAVNSQQLAAILSFADYEVNKNWTGHFLDSKEHTPDEYDAFNYEISGNGAGNVTVTWPESLLLSKWATNGQQVTSPYIFKVDDATTAVQFQFYRNPEKLSNLAEKSWEDLEALVTVSFTEEGKQEND